MNSDYIISLYIHTYTSLYIHIQVYTAAHVYIHKIPAHTYMYIHIHKDTSMYMYILQIDTDTDLYNIQAHTYMYIQYRQIMHIHTDTYTSSQWLGTLQHSSNLWSTCTCIYRHIHTQCIHVHLYAFRGEYMDQICTSGKYLYEPVCYP